MRLDYALYTIAITFFILTAVAAFILKDAASERDLSIIATTVFGLLFVGLGYSQRPKTITIEASPVSTPSTTIEEEAELTVTALTGIKGIGEKRKEQLNAIGINSLQELAKASPEDLAAILKISPKITGKWVEDAKEIA